MPSISRFFAPACFGLGQSVVDSRAQAKTPLADKACGNEPDKEVFTAEPPAQMRVALPADSECPGIARKPAVLGCRRTGSGSAGSIAIAKYVKRVAHRVAESVLVRLYGTCRAGYGVPAVLAAHRLFHLRSCLLVSFNYNLLAHVNLRTG